MFSDDSHLILMGQLFPIYVSVIMFYNGFYDTINCMVHFNLVNGHHSPLFFPLPIVLPSLLCFWSNQLNFNIKLPKL